MQTMADRPKTVDVRAILRAATQGGRPLRIAAIALGRVGNAACVAPLLETAFDADAELAKSRSRLAAVPGEGVNAQIVALLPTAEGNRYRLLIELVGQRRIAAVAELLKALVHSDRAMRVAALAALGETVDAQDLPVLIAQVVEPKHPDDAEPAARTRSRPRVSACPIANSVPACSRRHQSASSVPTKVTVLQTLGAVGGTAAWRAWVPPPRVPIPSFRMPAAGYWANG